MGAYSRAFTNCSANIYSICFTRQACFKVSGNWKPLQQFLEMVIVVLSEYFFLQEALDTLKGSLLVKDAKYKTFKSPYSEIAQSSSQGVL